MELNLVKLIKKEEFKILTESDEYFDSAVRYEFSNGDSHWEFKELDSPEVDYTERQQVALQMESQYRTNKREGIF